MEGLIVHELVSAATHGAALVAVIPAVVALYRRGDPLRVRRRAVLVYGLGLVACFAASTASHGLTSFGVKSATATLIDHIGIFLLIAGTYTPVAAAILPRERRAATLWAIWAVAAVGIALNLLLGPLKAWLATSFYLAMGWGGLWCYVSLRPMLSHRQLAAISAGGLLYSVGALFHLARWPVIWPGVFGGHELFHVFVVAGAATHFLFIWKHMPTAEAGRSDIAETHLHRFDACSQPAPSLGVRRSP